MTMTDKAYIVANKQQEIEVLKKFEKDGLKWRGNRNPTEFFPSDICLFPIVLFKGDCITWSFSVNLNIEEIVYDGRKEEKMYKVTQEFMNELIKWRYADLRIPLTVQDLALLPVIISSWCFENESPIENSNRLFAIISWLNGEEMFEVDEPSKFIIRSEKPNWDGDYWYVLFKEGMTATTTYLSNATKFNTYEDAKEWANSHQVAVEIDAEGNEVG